jgi:hypothetical protein
MAENRLARELESRTTAERPRQWQQPELLPEPDKNPDYEYRWVRISTLDKSDARNFSAKLREGWEPVPVEEQPKFRILIDPQSRFKENIEIGGLLLCKTPKAFVEQRTEYFARQTQAQTEAVDNNFMRQSDSRMPLFRERKSEVSFGKGQ